MAAEDQIVSMLRADPGVTAIVGQRVYAIPAPQGTPSPFLTYQVLPTVRSGHRYDGEGLYYAMPLQVDCWAEDGVATNTQSRYHQVTELARAVRTALDGQSAADGVALIRWDSWGDFNTPSETRRSLDFTLLIRE